MTVTEGSTNRTHSDWISNAALLQVFVGRDPMASLVTHRGSVLKQLIAFDWKRLFDDSGFTGVYLLGLFDNRGPIVVTEEEGTQLSIEAANRLPSVFALRDHSCVNPLLGTNDELAELVAVIHKANGKVLVDFVPNHTALSHPWLSSHPEFYHRDPNSSSGFVEEFSGDVVKLNYENQLLRAAQIKVIEGIAGTGCDGIRCDMAHLVPNHFWIEALSTIRRSFPGFAAIAEAYGTNVFDWSPFEHLLQAGFNAMYHDYLYRNLRQVGEHGSPLSDLAGHLSYVAHSPLREGLVNYVMNHDDAYSFAGGRGLEALTALMQFLPGASLTFNGQTQGRYKRLAHHSYEQLLASETLGSPVPMSLRKCFQLRQAKRPLLVQCVAHPGELLLAELATQGERYLFAANIGWALQHVPSEGLLGVSVQQHSKRLLHSGQTDVVLQPGEYEVFAKA
jgi:hypothetical protein